MNGPRFRGPVEARRDHGLAHPRGITGRYRHSRARLSALHASSGSWKPPSAGGRPRDGGGPGPVAAFTPPPVTRPSSCARVVPIIMMRRFWHRPCLRGRESFVSVTFELHHRAAGPPEPSMRSHPPPRLLGIAWALTCVLVGLPGCGGSPRMSSVPAAGELPDQEVSDFEASETDQGALQWKMYARSAATYRARNTVIATGLRIDFYGDDRKRSSTLTAREGEMNDLTHDMTARGDVVIQTTEGTRMTTSQLQFLNKQQRIQTEAFVRVDRRGDVLTGWGFESDPDLKDFQFKRQVKATVHTRSGGRLEQKGSTR